MSATIFTLNLNGQTVGNPHFERESAEALAAKTGATVTATTATVVKDQTVGFVRNGAFTQTLMSRTLTLTTVNDQTVGSFTVKGQTFTATRSHGKWVVLQ